jgi:hypothetical protein
MESERTAHACYPDVFDVPSLGTIVAHFNPRVVIFLSCGRIFGQWRKVGEKTAGRQLVLEAGSEERRQISDRFRKWLSYSDDRYPAGFLRPREHTFDRRIGSCLRSKPLS